MAEKTLEEMMAEFAAKGGKVNNLEQSTENGLRTSLGNVLKIEHLGPKKNKVVLVVHFFDEKKNVRILTRAEDRAGVEVGKNYSFTYKTHLAGKTRGVNFVTRGVPTEIRAKDNQPPPPAA